MVEPVTINLQHVARDLRLPLPQVQAAVELLDDGNTVPFITRYRKDQTGGLDEEQIRRIQERLRSMRLLAERKQTILRSIESQGKLTERLAKLIEAAATTKRLEDLYLPFKPKKQTLATLARSRGLEPLAHEILAAAPICADLDARAADFVNEDKNVKTAADALLGAGHILAEQFSEMAELRQRLREVLQRTGVLISSQIAPASKSQEAAPAKKREPPKPAAAEEKIAGAEAAPAAEAASAESPESHPVARAVDQTPSEEETAPTVAAVQTPAPEPAKPDSDTMASLEMVSEGAPPNGISLPAVQDAAGPDVSAAGNETDAAVVPETSEPVASEASHPPAGDTPPAPAPVAKKAVSRQPTPAQTKKQQIYEKRLKAFSDYFDYRESAKKVPPHRVLAINRGERARILRVRIESDVKAAEKVLDELLIPVDHPHIDFLRGCARDALARLILPSLERELRREMTDRAETHAVEVFAKNLRNLLLQPPIRDSRVLAVDPGYRSGCKLVALDQFGNLLAHDVIYLVGKSQRKDKAKETVTDLVDRFALKVVVIGNGTACRETEDFFAKLIAEELKDRELAYVIVNEAGASVYSTSRQGREEFSEYDATVRGAVSIGRRLQDPLSELVKIDPARIGVGLYQHDVKAKHLHSSLDDVVESCVNYVGVNLNTASPALLRRVSGLNQLTARRICEHRLQHGPFRSREQLKAVPGIGESTFVQAAGFLKITGGEEPLDATWIHPESYPLTTQVLAELGYSVENLADKAMLATLPEKAATLDLTALGQRWQVGTMLLADILAQLGRPGRDPREDLPKPVFKRGVLKLDDLSVGMALYGTVLNVVDFGAFVDIGMHDSGLVHISQMANQFVRDPHDIVAVGDIVKVWVIEVNKERRRVSLTMIPPGTKPPERAPRPPRGKPEGAKKPQQAPDGTQPPAGPRRPRRGGDGQKSGGREGGGQGRREGGREGSGREGGRGRQGGGPGRGRRFERTAYQPKPRPKPVVPITKKMVAGVEPMRTFGDLAQFFEIRQSKGDESPAKPESQKTPPETAPAPSVMDLVQDEAKAAPSTATPEPIAPTVPCPPETVGVPPESAEPADATSRPAPSDVLEPSSQPDDMSSDGDLHG